MNCRVCGGTATVTYPLGVRHVDHYRPADHQFVEEDLWEQNTRWGDRIREHTERAAAPKPRPERARPRRSAYPPTCQSVTLAAPPASDLATDTGT